MRSLERLTATTTRCLAAAAFLLSTALAASPAQTVWISSNDQKPWVEMQSPAGVTEDPADPSEVRVWTERSFQQIDGFGGCFNELGWVALGKASATDRTQVIEGLFGDEGCAFTLARLPIGASDFATSAYSLDDTPGDLALSHFSIERDQQALIPFVKAAMQVRPELACWGSPWSPPAWMKTNNRFNAGSLRWEPEVLQAYASYLVRWIETYRAAGVRIYALSPQNEPSIVSDYPSCLWTGAQLREFIGQYLGPTVVVRNAKVEIWLCLNGEVPNNGSNSNDRLAAVMEDQTANAFVSAIGLQYDSTNQIAEAGALYPEKRLYQTETICNSGENSWADAQNLFRLMKRYFDNGANGYFAWNMVLDETGESTWNWRQNALVTVDSRSGDVTYNGEYFVMRHFSRFVAPGAHRVLSTGGWGDKIAFVNPDGSAVLVVGNSLDSAQEFTFSVVGAAPGERFEVVLPPRSINTFIVPSGSGGSE